MTLRDNRTKYLKEREKNRRYAELSHVNLRDIFFSEIEEPPTCALTKTEGDRDKKYK